MKIEIKNRFNNQVIFAYECDNNSIKKTAEEAIKQKISLSRADLREADLREANLSRADLSRASLSRANLSRADLSWADLSWANLSRANLSRANLSWADLNLANLRDIKTNHLTTGFHLACPETGSFIAYKKCRNNVIVTLKITEDAKRSSGTTLKCRASKAKVLALSYGEIAHSIHDNSFTYQVGKIIEIPDFDDNRWNESSKGIHFFMNEEAALSYES